MLYDEEFVLDMVTVNGILYKPCHITINKTDIIDRYHFLKYNYKWFNLNNKRSCVGNGRLFYFNNDGKLQLLHIQKERFTVEKYVPGIKEMLMDCVFLTSLNTWYGTWQL